MGTRPPSETPIHQLQHYQHQQYQQKLLPIKTTNPVDWHFWGRVAKTKQKKGWPKYNKGENFCRVDGSALERRINVLPQTLKDFRVLHNLKEIDGRDVEDPKNFPNSCVISVVRMGREFEGIMGMLGEANQVLVPLVHFMDHEKYVNSVMGRVPISIHPSLYRAGKFTFLQSIGGLARDSTIDKEMDMGSMSQAVGVLTPAMFRLSTQPLY